MRELPLYAIIVLLLVLFTCNKPTKKTIVTEHYRDTIVIHDTFNHSTLRVDTFYSLNYDTIIEGKGFDVNMYEYKINDSLLTGTIRATSPVEPLINFDYYVKSFKVKDSVRVIKSDLRGFYYGGSLVVSPVLNSVFIGLGYMNKKGDIIDLSIGKDFSNNTNLLKLGFKKRI